MSEISETLDITPAAPPSRPLEDPSREIRIGLVHYGGVSLAIYIYGVVFEFWRLVRASCGEEHNTYSAYLKLRSAKDFRACSIGRVRFLPPD
jgi:hypothetical protein